ncbi:amidohydrolase family protein [SCandidatus Aminicenantes bacterium Aminicenantia_JdfR_composite]|nr:amidohydrolase family protein [SCandidatus Aminicenantes bacterium Aminicenantia_JdfR_composite]MCP2620817.1 amidohydrolase family protein [Candidatus Aminicenantes bacterium AC-334-E05]
MRAKKFLKVVYVCFFILCGGLYTYSNSGLHEVWAIKNCKIYTLNGAPIEKGTIVIRKGLIEAVGTDIKIPPDAEIIDASNLIAYPGLIDGLGKSFLKLPKKKIDMQRLASGEFTDEDRGITPGREAFELVEFSKATLDKFHRYGFTTVQIIPERGILTGQASIFNLIGNEKNKALLLKDTLLGIGFSPGMFGVYPSSLMGVVAFLRQTFSDVIYYNMHFNRWKKEMNGLIRPVYNLNFEILDDFITGKKPVVFFCRNQHDIKRALKLSKEFNLNYFICDLGSEAFRVIPELKKARARLFLTVEFKVPSTSIYARKGKSIKEKAEKEIYPKNPAKIAEAGIPFAFSSLGTNSPEKMIEGIRKAIENGLSKEDVLKALTIVPSSFMGLSKALGTIEPGKIANLILMEGEIFSKDAKVRYVFVDGKKFEIKKKEVKKGKEAKVNVTGKWGFEVQTEMGTMTFTVEFKQEESSLSGKLISQFGTFEFSDGTVSGNEISFDVTIFFGGQEMELAFSGVVEEDTMTGTVVQGSMGSAEFTAKRIPEGGER